MQTSKFTSCAVKSCHILQKSKSKGSLCANFSGNSNGNGYVKPPRNPTQEFTPPKLNKRPKKPREGPPPVPTKCCQKGCDNCVWIRYAGELIEYYKDGGVAAAKAIDAIEDPALKAFLKMEMKSKYGQ